MVERAHWLDDSFLRTHAARQARAVGARLDDTARSLIVAQGDGLARTSVVVAQRHYLHAPAIAAAFGNDGLQRWAAAGAAFLASDPPNREAALAFFSVPVKAVLHAGADAVVAWAHAGNGLAEVSRRLASEFLSGTTPLLGRIAAPNLAAWAEQGRALSAADGWRGEFFARALFAASSAALVVLGPEEYAAFARLAPALARAVRETDVYAPLPAGLHLLKPEERALLFDAVQRAAADDPRAAWTVYRETPPALRRLHGSLRGRMLRILAAAAGAATAELRDVLPVAAALARDIPQAIRAEALDLAAHAAETFPRAGVALLRSLPVAYEEAPPTGVATWIERGLALARDNPDAGLAFFARESRTSLKILHASSTAATLDDVQGTLRKYVRMLSGRSAAIRAATSVQIRPELEEFPLEDEIALPLQIDRFATYEDNFRLYRLLAAQLAGRRICRTYEAQRPAEEGKSLYDFVTDPEKPVLLEDLFLVCDGYRVATSLAREFPGLAREQRDLARNLLDRALAAPQPARSAILDLISLWLLSDRLLSQLPGWLQKPAAVIGPCVAPLALASATVDDALAIAERLTAELAQDHATRAANELDELAFERLASDAVYDMYVDEDGPTTSGAGPATPNSPAPPEPNDDGALDRQLELDDELDDASGGASMSAEELQRLLESGVDLRIKQSSGSETDGLGLYVSDLLGKLPRDQLEELQRVLGEGQRTGRPAARRWMERRIEGTAFYYDEWDYHIQDYRQRWCRLLEVPVAGDSGEFFQQALADYAELIPEVRRQFQRIRPETYRIVRGLEHGEDFDLNAVVDARIERRARRSPSERLYVARQREERDVATLFLIDLSASTDEPFATGEPSAAGPSRPRRPRRIIDVTKEALVIMAEALEEIGDAYAIYGFSGHGRKNVEFYMVKSFNETLSGAVKGRIGALEPKRSTRMGTALRHSIEKLNAVSARSRNILLLSDGFPQDFDYGQDRRSNVYGLRDTTIALREAETTGIVPFCLTVDRAGHDYLREMCDESRYMVIDDIASLPRELPKVYQRLTRPTGTGA